MGVSNVRRWKERGERPLYCLSSHHLPDAYNNEFPMITVSRHRRRRHRTGGGAGAVQWYAGPFPCLTCPLLCTMELSWRCACWIILLFYLSIYPANFKTISYFLRWSWWCVPILFCTSPSICSLFSPRADLWIYGLFVIGSLQHPLEKSSTFF